MHRVQLQRLHHLQQFDLEWMDISTGVKKLLQHSLDPHLKKMRDLEKLLKFHDQMLRSQGQEVDSLQGAVFMTKNVDFQQIYQVWDEENEPGTPTESLAADQSLMHSKDGQSQSRSQVQTHRSKAPDDTTESNKTGRAAQKQHEIIEIIDAEKERHYEDPAACENYTSADAPEGTVRNILERKMHSL